MSDPHYYLRQADEALRMAHRLSGNATASAFEQVRNYLAEADKWTELARIAADYSGRNELHD